MIKILVTSLVLLSAGCVRPTTFTGEAKVVGGPAGCQAKCASWGMELAGMVVMGEYSDGCICQIRGKGAAPASEPARPPGAEPASQRGIPDVTGVGPAVAGVALQVRRMQEQSALEQQQYLR
jgi:hypothetical protein